MKGRDTFVMYNLKTIYLTTSLMLQKLQEILPANISANHFTVTEVCALFLNSISVYSIQ